KVRSINAAPGEIVVQVREREAGREEKIRLDPGFRKSVGVEQVVAGTGSISDFSLDWFTGRLIYFQRVVQFARLITQSQAEIGFQDAVGHVELKNITSLVDVIERRTEPPCRTAARMGGAPDGGTFVSGAE